MHDEGRAAGVGNRADEVAHETVLLDLVDADPVLDGHIDVDRVRIALTQSATSCGSAIRQAPNAPFCTRSDGQPQLRLISS